MKVYRIHRTSRLLFLTTFVALVCMTAARGEETKRDPSPFARLKFRAIGPAAGGRVCRVAGVPGDPLTCYAATAASGLWKSIDGGIHWKPIADDQPTSTFGSLAVAPSDANVIYAGSGEANIRGNIEVGNGIYKSTDAGKTWKHVWNQEGQIGTTIVHPRNPDIAFAAVLGHAFGPNPERGVYRTLDGGKNWQRVLFKDADTGASDVCFDPTNPKIVFAGLWQTRRRPWELLSGGPGSGLYVSRDGGDTWTRLISPPPGEEVSSEPGAAATGGGKKYAKGLPKGIWGKVGVAVAPSDGRRVYALIEADKGGLFRSDNGGDTWKLINDWRAIRQRAFYYSTLTIDPRNPDIIWCPQVPLLKSIDGGKTFQRVKGPHHGDHHDIWIDPKDPRRILNGNDGGVDLSSNGGETWFAPPLPWGQFYHISVDNRLPYHVAGTMQDIGTGSG
ncbi:MAG: WD40/YVTN/BNR-like repeat-containing protein, partial [Gemmataceae bacterium]